MPHPILQKRNSVILETADFFIRKLNLLLLVVVLKVYLIKPQRIFRPLYFDGNVKYIFVKYASVLHRHLDEVI